MNMGKNLKNFLDKIEQEYPQHLLKIEKEIDPSSFEISAIIQHLIYKNKNPVVLLKRTKDLKGNRSGFALVDNLFATRELCALALDLHPGNTDISLSLEFSKREVQKIEPVIINKKEAPVKDVIIQGDEIDIRDLPVPRYHEMDLGPYLTMANIMKDEDGNFYDVSFVKNMVIDSKTLTVSLHHTERPHLFNILEKNDKKDLSTPIVIVLGHHPAFYLGTGALKEFGNNDYETIGAFLQEPLRLTSSESWGGKFLVPADAEIVIEGEVIPKEREIQNPFGEYTGYYQPQCLMPVMKVKAITHKNNAIMQGVFPGHESHFNLGSIPKEGSIYNNIKKIPMDVVGVHLPHSGVGRLSCYISIRKKREGDAKQAGLVPFLLAQQIKYVIVVDDDIDVFNEREVIWAIITRLNLSKGVDIIKNMPRSDKIIIDATKPLDVPFLEKNKIPDEVMKRIQLEDLL
jgi:2,5-furandicarboxylate decarboxylase 1